MVRTACSLPLRRRVDVHRILAASRVQRYLTQPLEAVEEDEVIAHVLALPHQVLRLLTGSHAQNLQRVR